MKWIKSINFGTIPSGTNAGVIAFQLHFTGTTPPQEEMLDTLYRIRNHPTPYRNILLSGVYPPSEPVIYTFCKALSDAGFAIEADIDGQVAYSWLKLCKWVVAEITTAPWAGFTTNEIRWTLKDLSDEEPMVPEAARLYIDFDRQRIPADKVLTLLDTFAGRWSVLPEMKAKIIRSIG